VGEQKVTVRQLLHTVYEPLLKMTILINTFKADKEVKICLKLHTFNW